MYKKINRRVQSITFINSRKVLVEFMMKVCQLQSLHHYKAYFNFMNQSTSKIHCQIIAQPNHQNITIQIQEDKKEDKVYCQQQQYNQNQKSAQQQSHQDHMRKQNLKIVSFPNSNEIENEELLKNSEISKKQLFKVEQQDITYSLQNTTIDNKQETKEILQQKKQASKILPKATELAWDLQQLLKEEYLLVSTQHEQKCAFEKKLNTAISTYYQNKVLSPDTHFFQEHNFSNSGTFISEIILTLSKNPSFTQQLLLHHHRCPIPAVDYTPICHLVMNSLHENIVDDNILNKDTSAIITFLIQSLLPSRHYSSVDFLCTGITQGLLNELFKKDDITAYAKAVTKNALLQIILIDFNLNQEKSNPIAPVENKRPKRNVGGVQHKYSMGLPSSMASSKSEIYNIDSFVSHQKTQEKYSVTQAYADALRKYDERKKHKRRNKFTLSEELMKHLGLCTVIPLPLFVLPSATEVQRREEIKLNKGFTIMHNSREHHPLNIMLNNIILTLFNDCFKMLYSMPPLMRYTCSVIYQIGLTKYDRKGAMYVLGVFVVEKWLSRYINLVKLTDHYKTNAELVVNIMSAVVRSNYSGINQSFIQQFGELIRILKVSVDNWLTQIINIEQKSKCTQQSTNPQGVHLGKVNKIKSYCVCLSIRDIETIMQIMKHSQMQLVTQYEKVYKRIAKIQEMQKNECSRLFQWRTDRSSKRTFPPQQSFVLFFQLLLPSQLALDYNKYYNSAFKQNKLKNLLRKVLLSLPELWSCSGYSTSLTLDEFFLNLQSVQSLYSTDSIPLRTKLKYLLSLLQKNSCEVVHLIDEMRGEVRERLRFLRGIWLKTKSMYLLAISNVYEQNSRIEAREAKAREQAEKKHLNGVIGEMKLAMCLTSPRTRENELIMRTNILRDYADESKLWLFPVSNCIHTLFKLNFIKSLTGEPEKSKCECHITSVNKFADIFCSLPEVRERGICEDTIGMRDVFYSFIDHCKEESNAVGWAETIEHRVSKRIYEKIYPKMPTYEDIAFYMRLKTLGWITLAHLGIPEELQVGTMWDVAAARLLRIDRVQTAGQKLKCIIETNQTINKSLRLLLLKEYCNAEDIMPAAPKRIISNVSFIELFCNKLQGIAAYYFLQLKAAISFCEEANHHSLIMKGSDAENYIEFQKNVYLNEISHGIYFLLGRKKQSSHSEQDKLQYIRKFMKQRLNPPCEEEAVLSFQ